MHWYPTFKHDETTALTTIDGIMTGNGNVTINGVSITNTTVNQAQISSIEAALRAVQAERAEWERNPPGLFVGRHKLAARRYPTGIRRPADAVNKRRIFTACPAHCCRLNWR